MQLRRKQLTQKQDPCLSPNEVPLTCLNEGAEAVMIHTFGDANVVRRLSEMGLTPGYRVKLLRKCAFHGPIEVEIRGVSLALGYDLASKILVQSMKAN